MNGDFFCSHLRRIRTPQQCVKRGECVGGALGVGQIRYGNSRYKGGKGDEVVCDSQVAEVHFDDIFLCYVLFVGQPHIMNPVLNFYNS